MKSEAYWTKRMDDLNEAMLSKGEAYTKAQDAEYEKAMARIRKETEAWYARLARNNDISMAEARKLLTAGELKEFRWTVEDYIKAGRENAVDQRWMKELENASAKVHITRLQELETKLRQEVETLAAKRLAGTAATMSDIYKDGYYRGVFEVQRGVGEGVPFARLDGKQIDTVLAKPWAPDGKNFSARIWADRDKMVGELQKVLTQNLIRGEPADRTIADFAQRMGVSQSAARRLIMTEAAYFSGQSRLDGYKQTDVKQYKFVATLDARTSDQCRSMDGEVIPVSEAQAGTNYPPLHAHCRSTTIPYFEDAAPGQRAARGEDGKTYTVPGDTTYKEWAKDHVPPDADKPPKADPPAPKEPPKVGVVEEPPGTPNRRFNPKASYHIDLPDVSEEVGEQLAEVNREITRKGSKEGKETAVLLDAKTGEEVGRTSGTINEAKFSEEMDQTLRTAPDNSVILTHNHPQGTRINVKDLQNLSVYPALSAVVAAGHDGGMSAVASLGNNVSLLVFNDLMLKIAQKVAKELQSSERYDTMSVSERHAYLDHVILLAIIKELGWAYVEDFGAARASNWGI